MPVVPASVAGTDGPRPATTVLLAALPPVGLGQPPTSRELELSDGELVIARSALDELHDELYVLACAVDDAERDLAAAGRAPTASELARILDWLLEAARPLRAREVPHPGDEGHIPS